MEADELARIMDDPKLVILDCTVKMITQPVGASLIESGLPGFLKGHIPGAQYVHLVDDISAPHLFTAYGVPSPDRMTRLLRRLGVSNDSTVVLYGSSYPATVTRAFWIFDLMGVKNLRLLNGGWQSWTAAGLPVETGEGEPRVEGDFVAHPDVARMSEKGEMCAAIDDPGTQLLNALSREQFLGTGGAHYGRPGRIPNSINLPFRDTYDAETLKFHPIQQLQDLVAEAGVRFDRKVRIYCGGGIAASGIYFVLRTLGHPSISLYDGSLLDWSNDPAMPMIIEEAEGQN